MKRVTRAAIAASVLMVVAASAPFALPTPRAVAVPGDGPVTASTTVFRQHVGPNGPEAPGPSNHVTVTVSQTMNLRGRQQIDVSWTGAHPTGGLVPDPNSQAAALQEYPVVIMECRGIESGGQHIDPSTCWTQTVNERMSMTDSTAFPEWRLDRYAPPDERKAVVDAPDAQTLGAAPDPANCKPSWTAERYVPFVDPNGKKFYFGPFGSCGLPPEAVNITDNAAPPANTTYGVTDLNGNGDVKFVVWTAEQNASLGCSNTVPCSLVVIPIAGISCDATAAGLPAEDRPPADVAAAADAACRKSGHFNPGEIAPNQTVGDPAVSGALWWSASNWRNKIAIPLTFAPPSNVCSIVDPRTPVDFYGSELMDQAMTQWAAAFCQDPKLFNIRHVKVPEPLAKTALAAKSIYAALISRPPDGGFTAPTIASPVGVTGFAISYVIDDSSGHAYTSLRLNPRLLAKLLSESYWALPELQHNFAALPPSDPYHVMASNPQDLSVDPEFIALNPGVGPTLQHDVGSTLLALSGNSDVMFALMSYINADPEARAFLDGQPDPWGMRVNPSYRGLPLPQESWPLLDSFLSPTIKLGGCLVNASGQLVPVPVLPLIAAPMSQLFLTAQAVQYALGNAGISCNYYIDAGGNVLPGGTLKPEGRQQPGSRFMLALTSLSDASLLGLRNAQLQSTAVVAHLNAKFTDDSGRSFVGPTDAGLQAAALTSTVDPVTHTWPISYDRLRQTPDAYPGTVIVYLAVPASGLDPTLAAELGRFMSFAGNAGQQPGNAEGQLPPGYLPMTAADGLGDLAAYAQLAAVAVANQTATVSSATPEPAPTGVTSTGGPPVEGVPNLGAAPAPKGSPSPIFSPWTPKVQTPAAYTVRTRSAEAGWVLPIAVLIALLAAAAAGISQTGGAMRAQSAIRSRIAHLAEMRSRQ
jgi:hypothetical protein